MTKQLTKHAKANSIYWADGVIRQLGIEDFELLLFEASRGYDQASDTKSSFDFHKGLYGTVAMLKTVANAFNHAKFEVFSTLKLHFLHAQGK